MSRLADTLMGMDRGASRPEGIGGIPPLGRSVGGRSKWRRTVVLAIVVGIVIFAATATFLRPRTAAVTPSRAPAPVAAAAPVIRPPAIDVAFDTLVGRGLRAAQDGNLLEAAGLLEEALEIKPADDETWNSLGVILVRRGETARGVEAFRRALRLRPNLAEAHRNLAVALDREGRPDEAVTHYRAFLSLSAKDHAARDEVQRRLAEVSDSNPNAVASR